MSRPWQKLFQLDAGRIFNAYNNCGIYTIQIFIKALKPLFKLKEISLDITMKELHLKSKKLLNIYATDTKTLEKKLFNYIETPDLKVMEAIYMSCSVPIIFKPMMYKDNYYIDGAFSCRFPIDDAMKNTESNDEILGINVKNNKESNLDCKNLLTYISTLTRKYANNKILVYDEKNFDKINIFHISSDNFSLDETYNILTDISYRRSQLENIEELAIKFINEL